MFDPPKGPKTTFGLNNSLAQTLVFGNCFFYNSFNQFYNILKNCFSV